MKFELDPDASNNMPSVTYEESGGEAGSIKGPYQQCWEFPKFQASSGIIDMAHNEKSNDVAVILHLFYGDLLDEINYYLQNLSRFDLYISTPESNRELEGRIFALFPNAKIFYTENRGRDILPFIVIYKHIDLLEYKYFLKLHTKKSPHRENGAVWRTDVYSKLMGSPNVAKSVITEFEDNRAVGVIGPKGHVIDCQTYVGGNEKKIRELAKRVGIYKKEYFLYNFVAGSMFWARPEALRHLASLPLQIEEFEPEPLGPDGALVHALERFIGLSVTDAGYSIFEVDFQGKISQPEAKTVIHPYPFSAPDNLSVSGKRSMGQTRNPVKYVVYRIMMFFKKIRLLGALLYNNREKIMRMLLEVIKNPKTVRLILQSVRLVKERLNLLSLGQHEVGGAASRIVSDQIELTERVDEKLKKCLMYGQYVISISHSDYIHTVGGVEIVIMDEQKVCNKNGVAYLHFYPYFKHHSEWVLGIDPFYIGINCNGETVGVTDREGLLFALSELDLGKLLNVFIHHTIGFDVEFLDRILKVLGSKRGRFWLHDNFSLCPGYTLLRNDLIYCGVPDINSNACFICKHGDARRLQQPAFRKLFENNLLEVVAPSRFTLDLWKEKSSFATVSEKVAPHVNLNWTGALQSRQFNHPIRVGFLGYPVYWKGWETWMRLISKFSDDSRYQFYCFTSWPKSSDKMKWVSVSVTKDNRLSMVTALKSNKIDVAFLWSLCPETFSFTLYESLAAGCYALTYKDSGNIQAYLNQNPSRGLVLKDEQALFELFSGDDLNSLITEYQKNGRPQGEFLFLPEFD